MIIANWNGKHFLAECLQSLQRQTFRDFETILVDNGSTDGSAGFVRTQFPELKLVALSENRGFTGGNIAGYEAAQGELITLLNNDTEADAHWLEEIYKAAQTDRTAGSFASKMLYFDDRTRIENCGVNLSLAGTTLDLGRDEPDGESWCSPRRVFGACGGAATYRRSVLNEIGFLDPEFFLIYEDVDLNFRAQLRGHECAYVPTAIVYHRYRQSIGKAPMRQVFFAQRNVEFVYFKNMPRALILRSLPQRILYEIGSGLYFARHGAIWPFLKAKLSVLRHLPEILRKRKEIQRSRCVQDAQLMAMLRKSTMAAKWKKLRIAFSTPVRSESVSQPR